MSSLSSENAKLIRCTGSGYFIYSVQRTRMNECAVCCAKQRNVSRVSVVLGDSTALSVDLPRAISRQAGVQNAFAHVRTVSFFTLLTLQHMALSLAASLPPPLCRPVTGHLPPRTSALIVRVRVAGLPFRITQFGLLGLGSEGYTGLVFEIRFGLLMREFVS